MSKSQINLPKTSFSMKANLSIREPEILEYWRKIDLYKKIRKSSKGKEKFVLHDGPPYANGNIHMGTALNKILKDVIVRTQQMAGKDSIYVPGWDCHGLPIEWKTAIQYINCQNMCTKKYSTCTVVYGNKNESTQKTYQQTQKVFLEAQVNISNFLNVQLFKDSTFSIKIV